VIVQRPDTAHAPSMPNAALGTGQVDQVVPLDGIAHALEVAVA
jgi:chemotaxis response regulator CheB